MRLRSCLIVLLMGVPALAGALVAPPVELPVGVSPGGANLPSVIADRCPTFSWAGTRGATAYELAVFSIADGLMAGGAEPALLDPEIQVWIDAVIPAPATSWTPAAAQCLESGRTYIWYVRELGAYGQPDGEWSKGMMFAVDERVAATPEAADGEDKGADKARGTGGIPAVQRQLDEIQLQMAEDRAALEALILTQVSELRGDIDARFAALTALVIARANSLDMQLGVLDSDPLLPSVAGRLQEIKDELFPCTPEREQNGECEGNNPLDLEITICGTVDAKAALGAAYSAGVKTTFKAGGRWDIVVLGAGELSGDMTAIPIGGIPLPLPRLSLSGTGGAGLVLKACLKGFKLKVPVDLPFEVREDLLESMQGPADEFLTTLGRMVGDLGLSPSKIEDLLEGLEMLQDPQVVLTDPLAFFDADGPLRELADNLPVGKRVQEFLDHPEKLLPSPSSCQEVVPDVDGFDDFEDLVCSVVDTTGQGFLDTINTIDTTVGTIEDAVEDVLDFLGIPLP